MCQIGLQPPWNMRKKLPKTEQKLLKFVEQRLYCVKQ